MAACLPGPLTALLTPPLRRRNPTNLRNVEKVWIAEQKAEAEEKKLAELKKQIAEERQLQELKELQVKAGLVDKGQLEKLDWMYEGPMATMQDHQNNTEQYLLGKEVTLKAADSEVKKVESQPGMLFLNSVSAKNDLFTRLHEDPLLLIKQNELKVRRIARCVGPGCGRCLIVDGWIATPACACAWYVLVHAYGLTPSLSLLHNTHTHTP